MTTRRLKEALRRTSVRAASSVRLAVRRTGLWTQRVVEETTKEFSPRKRGVRRQPSPSSHRRLYTKQKFFFERRQTSLSDDEEDEEEPSFRATAFSAAASACVFYYGAEALILAKMPSKTLRFVGALCVVLATAMTAVLGYIFFAPRVLGLEKGPLDVLWSESALFGDDDEDAFIQDEINRRKRAKAAFVVGRGKKRSFDEATTPPPSPPLTPKGSGAVLSSPEEASTAADAVRRCRKLGIDEDESFFKDPYLFVVHFLLDGTKADGIFDSFWADGFYADFLNVHAKNKKATATEWNSDQRTVTTLHPLATQIRLPGLSLVIPTVKSQRVFKFDDDDDDDDDVHLAIFERSKFESIPYADALRVETVWLFGGKEETEVRVYFRCLFIDKVLTVPRWIQRLAVAKTKGELHVTYSKWKAAALAEATTLRPSVEDPVVEDPVVEEIPEKEQVPETPAVPEEDPIVEEPRRFALVEKRRPKSTPQQRQRREPKKPYTRKPTKSFPLQGPQQQRRRSRHASVPPPPPPMPGTRHATELAVIEDILCFRTRDEPHRKKTRAFPVPPKAKKPPPLDLRGYSSNEEPSLDPVPENNHVFARVVAPPLEFPFGSGGLPPPDGVQHTHHHPSGGGGGDGGGQKQHQGETPDASAASRGTTDPPTAPSGSRRVVSADDVPPPPTS